jgi:hypothetical protein
VLLSDKRCPGTTVRSASMSFIVPGRFEGAPGRAQGGYAAGILHDGRPHRVWFRSAIPLDTELEVRIDGETTSVVLDGTLILESHPVDPLQDPLPPVTMDQAIAGRERVESAGLPEMIAPCYSCGTVEGTLRTHPGQVGDSDTWGAPMIYPDWTGTNGTVDPKHVWSVVDCAAGYPVALGAQPRMAFTGWLTVDVRSTIEPGQPTVVVATAGPWEGRKRSARSALWTEDGELVAVSESRWISVRRMN